MVCPTTLLAWVKATPRKDETNALLKQAKQGTDTVQEFAGICLQDYRKEALALPTQENVKSARARLVRRLHSLLRWAVSERPK